MADKTTGGLDAVREAPIGSLPGIADLYDDTLLPVEQQGEARHMTGRQWKKYAQAGVQVYVESAKDAADQAEQQVALAAGQVALAKEQVSLAAGQANAAAKSASNAAASAETARQYSGKPPVIIDGRWWTWNAAAQQYEDTGEAARGNLMYATFFLDAAAGDLYMFTDNEYTGPQFRLNGPDLEVVLSYGS